MSASTILSDITITLRDLLISEQHNSNFSVETRFPGDLINLSQTPMINLYLFRVEENGHAQNNDWVPVTDELHRYPPIALNLYYMLIPYANDQLVAYQVLGEAIRILYDHAIIDSSFLKGALEHTFEDLKVDLCKFNIEELTRIWNAFNQPYRLSLSYKVRIAYIDSLLNKKLTRVTEKESKHV